MEETVYTLHSIGLSTQAMEETVVVYRSVYTGDGVDCLYTTQCIGLSTGDGGDCVSV